MLFAGAGAGLTALAGFAYMRWVEADWFEVTRKRVEIGRFTGPLRILHLSDFHYSEAVSLGMIEKAIDLALEQEADLALLTGDFITHSILDAEGFGLQLGRLAARMPTIACMGNHDGGVWASGAGGYRSILTMRQLLVASGVRVLNNAAESIRVGPHSMTVVGLGDLWSYACRPERVLEKQRSRDEAVFVLSHNPDSKELLRPYDWDLALCGHTHGGQLVIPVLGLRPFLPVKDRTFAEGLLSWGKRHIHITRGVGNLHGVRFNCRPEISLLEVE